MNQQKVTPKQNSGSYGTIVTSRDCTMTVLYARLYHKFRSLFAFIKTLMVRTYFSSQVYLLHAWRKLRKLYNIIKHPTVTNIFDTFTLDIFIQDLSNKLIVMYENIEFNIRYLPRTITP